MKGCAVYFFKNVCMHASLSYGFGTVAFLEGSHGSGVDINLSFLFQSELCCESHTDI